MDLKPLQPGATRLSPSPSTNEIATLLRNWRVGQILEASVLGRGDRGSLLLNIQGVTLEAARPPELPFRPGQRLPVQILAREPQLELRLLAAPSDGIDPARIQQAMRQTLPRQQPLPPLLANLALLQRQPDSAPLPRDLLPLLRELWQALATREAVRQPAELAAALRASGPFLESALAAGLAGETAPPAGDLRGQLLRLAAALRQHLPADTALPPPATGNEYPAPRAAVPQPPLMRDPANPWAGQTGATTHARHHDTVRTTPSAQPPAPPSLAGLSRPETGVEELLRQVEGVIARTHTHALHSLHAQAEGRPLWAMELPIRHGDQVDVFDLRIEEEESHPEAENAAGRRWSVRLSFDLAGLGPVHALISLQAEAVATRFWVESPETARLFEHWLATLESRLRQAGLQVSTLECRCGPPPDDGRDPPPLIREQA